MNDVTIDKTKPNSYTRHKTNFDFRLQLSRLELWHVEATRYIILLQFLLSLFWNQTPDESDNERIFQYTICRTILNGKQKCLV